MAFEKSGADNACQAATRALAVLAGLPARYLSASGAARAVKLLARVHAAVLRALRARGPSAALALTRVAAAASGVVRAVAVSHPEVLTQAAAASSSDDVPCWVAAPVTCMAAAASVDVATRPAVAREALAVLASTEVGPRRAVFVLAPMYVLTVVY